MVLEFLARYKQVKLDTSLHFHQAPNLLAQKRIIHQDAPNFY